MLGIGTSNPQVVEGWYGQPYPRPLERTREYIDILRKVIARGEPVRKLAYLALGIAVDQKIGLGIQQDRAAHLFRPIIKMRDATQ